MKTHSNKEEIATVEPGRDKVEPLRPTAEMALLTAPELLRVTPPPTRKHWGKLIKSQQLGMLSGPRGKGKTWAAMGLAMAMASGAEFLGNSTYNSKRRKVIYLDGEMNVSTIQQRLRTLAQGMQVEVPETLRVFTPDTFSGLLPAINKLDDQKKFNELIGEDWDVLFIDNYSMWSAAGSESAEAFQPLMQWMLEKKRGGKTVIVVHHTGKNGQQRGSSKHEDPLDFSIALIPSDRTSEDGALNFSLTWRKLRHMPAHRAPTLSISLRVTKKYGAVWKSEAVANATDKAEEIRKLQKTGLNNVQIAKKLNVHKSTVGRRSKQ